MEVVAEALLSSVLNFLIGQLASSDLMKLAREERVHTELKKWKTELLGIQRQLGEAEEKQITDDNAKSWLNELRALAYDMEDVLDEFASEVARRKLMVAQADEPGTSNRKLCKFIPTCCTNFNPTHTLRLLNMGPKIQNITARLKDISDEKAEHVLTQVIGAANPAWQRSAPTTPIAYEPGVHGRDEDQKAILDMLGKVETYGSNFDVISIVGPGGMGKTTLARQIFNNEAATQNFDLKAWACVSDVFHLENVTKSILNSIKQSDASGSSDFQQFQRELRDAVANKKLLLILDDVWTQNRDHWNSLQAPLSVAAKGSKVIVTTRHRNSALMMGSQENLHELKPLSQDACFSVFVEQAFKFRDVADHPNLVPIGKKIVAKCGGLPLAAKALGGLLQAKVTEEDWERVLNSKIWQLPSSECNILPPLWLSYHHLPSYLKRCFAYCAIFPKDYEFDPKVLVLLWMAEGLIGEPSSGNLTIEDQGDECFRELFSRSFFQLSGNQDSHFVMHDLMYDLAQDVSKGICLCLEDNLESDQQFHIPIGTRHLSVTIGKFHLFKKLEDFQVLQKLRTFVGSVPSLAHDDLISKFQYLRVLSSQYGIYVLPDSIGGLKHLRYLNLAFTKIESLPDSITNLCNLQTLVLHGCRRLTRLPIDIGKLINLRHLDVGGCPLQEMSQQIGRLKQLQTLSNFIVGKRGFLGIKELKDLSNLKGQISISRLENVIDIQDTRDANLKDKLKIEKLSLIWREKMDGLHDEDVLFSLQPNTNLKELKIKGYGGGKFSNWISSPSYYRLVELSLSGCVKCKSLPSIGQLPSLRELSMEGMDGVESVGVEFEGRVLGHNKPFQCLGSLWFKGMKEWSWSSQSFSSLRHLEITDCPKLVGKVPVHLSSLVKFYVVNCPEMIVPLPMDLPSFQKFNHYYFQPKLNYCQGGSGSNVTLAMLALEVSGISAGLYRELKHSLPSAVDFVGIDNTCTLNCEWVDGIGVGGLEISGYKLLEWLGEEEEQGRLLKIISLAILYYESLPGWIMMRKDNNCTPIEKLVIRGCPSLICFPRGTLTPTLKVLYINDCKNLASLPEEMGGLEELYIDDCPSLVGFPKGPVSPTLKTLNIRDCENLASLPEDMCGLEQLYIRGCPSLVGFPKGPVSSTLKTLNIWDCESLASFPEDMCGLEQLYIRGCPSLVGFPKGPVSPTLKTLEIQDCKNLASLPEDICMCAALEELELSGCPGVIGFPEGGLPPTLKSLTIRNCGKLGSLPEGIMQMPPHSSSALEDLKILECPSLTCFPRGKFPSTLQTLEIRDCLQLPPMSNHMFDPYSTHSLESMTLVKYPNLKTIPHHSLHSLKHIRIEECENLGLQPRVFQNLTSLASLAISDCENIKTQLSEWGLSGLTSLAQLSIQSISPEAAAFFPDHRHLPPLPATLIELTISGFRNLESLAFLSLQTLNSLRRLSISDCPRLHSFVPKEGLPDMLVKLAIENCPLLIQRCSKESGEDWPKIAHIHFLLIDKFLI